MRYKLVYHDSAYFAWGVAMWTTIPSRWIEQAQFLLRMDALIALAHWNERGYL